MTRPWMLLWRAEADLQLALSVDPKPAVLIDRTWDVPVSHIAGENITDQHAMRDGVIMTVSEHINRISGNHHDREILALFSNGNFCSEERPGLGARPRKPLERSRTRGEAQGCAACPRDYGCSSARTDRRSASPAHDRFCPRAVLAPGHDCRRQYPRARR